MGNKASHPRVVSPNEIKQQFETINVKRIADDFQAKLQSETRKAQDVAKRIQDDLKKKIEAKALAVALEVKKQKAIDEEIKKKLVIQAQKVIKVAQKAKDDALEVAKQTEKIRIETERKTTQLALESKQRLIYLEDVKRSKIKNLIKPIEEGVKIIKNIPKTITVDLKHKITKDLPAVLMPVATTVMKDIMPKPKPIQNDGGGQIEYGYYQDADGSYWQSDATGFHPYVPNDPIYSQDASGNYWVNYGSGATPYSPEMERLANGFYEGADGDFWEQSDEGLNPYTPQNQNNEDDAYWVKSIL